MSTAATYRIIDEPRPSGLAHLSVNPIWPLLGHMFCGPWFAWIWFTANGFAIGSPTRKRELLIAVVGFIGLALMVMGLGVVYGNRMLPKETAVYAVLFVTLWKLGISYWLFALQSASFDLYQYFGGSIKSGLLVVIGGHLLNPVVLNLFPNSLWKIFVS